MSNVVNDFASIVYDALLKETEYGHAFEDFHLFDESPESGALVFPCIMMTREPIGTTEKLFGENEVRSLNIVIEVAFKEKTGFVSREHDYLSTEKLVMWYEERLNEIVRNIERKFQRVTPVIDVIMRSERHIRDEKFPELYGLTYTITIIYAV